MEAYPGVKEVEEPLTEMGVKLVCVSMVKRAWFFRSSAGSASKPEPLSAAVTWKFTARLVPAKAPSWAGFALLRTGAVPSTLTWATTFNAVPTTGVASVYWTVMVSPSPARSCPTPGVAVGRITSKEPQKVLALLAEGTVVVSACAPEVKVVALHSVSCRKIPLGSVPLTTRTLAPKRSVPGGEVVATPMVCAEVASVLRSLSVTTTLTMLRSALTWSLLGMGLVPPLLDTQALGVNVIVPLLCAGPWLANAGMTQSIERSTKATIGME